MIIIITKSQGKTATAPTASRPAREPPPRGEGGQWARAARTRRQTNQVSKQVGLADKQVRFVDLTFPAKFPMGLRLPRARQVRGNLFSNTTCLTHGFFNVANNTAS